MGILDGTSLTDWLIALFTGGTLYVLWRNRRQDAEVQLDSWNTSLEATVDLTENPSAIEDGFRIACHATCPTESPAWLASVEIMSVTLTSGTTVRDKPRKLALFVARGVQHRMQFIVQNPRNEMMHVYVLIRYSNGRKQRERARLFRLFCVAGEGGLRIDAVEQLEEFPSEWFGQGSPPSIGLS